LTIRTFIPVFEAGEASGVLFIAMRLVRGGDVRGLIGKHGPLQPWRAVWIVAAVASALDAAHVAGLIHRDVKPANMLLDVRPGRLDHVYLSDFGLSKGSLGTSGLTGSGQFLGTVDYAAPEQLSGKAVDCSADQYSLGCAAFELLCGRPPFRRDQGLAVVYAHLSESPPLATSRRPDLLAGVDRVFTRVLAKHPADRYASCHEFAADLRRELHLQNDANDSARALLMAVADAATAEATGHAPAGLNQQLTGTERATRQRRRGKRVLPAAAAASFGAALASAPPLVGKAAASPALETAQPVDFADRPVTEPAAPAAPDSADQPVTEPAAPPVLHFAGRPATEPAAQPTPAPAIEAPSREPRSEEAAGLDSAEPSTSHSAVIVMGTDESTGPILGTTRTTWNRPRTWLMSLTLALAAATATMLILLTGSHPQRPHAAAPRPYTFAPHRYGDGLVVDRRWKLAGPGGSVLKEFLAVTNATKKTITTVFAEPIPPSIAAKLGSAVFKPDPLKLMPADLVVEWSLHLPPGASAGLSYAAHVTQAGTTSARLVSWATEIKARETTLNPSPAAPIIRTLTIMPRQVRISIGRTYRFRLSGSLRNGTPARPAALAKASWRTANSAVATVSATGKVTGRRAGTTRVTAMIGTIRAAARLTVLAATPSPAPATGPAPPASTTPAPTHSTPAPTSSTITGHPLVDFLGSAPHRPIPGRQISARCDAYTFWAISNTTATTRTGRILPYCCPTRIVPPVAEAIVS
jgi:serine/threonine-protein kinase